MEGSGVWGDIKSGPLVRDDDDLWSHTLHGSRSQSVPYYYYVCSFGVS